MNATKTKTPSKLVTTSSAAESLKISVAQFNRIVAKRGYEPADTYTNPHYRSGPPAKLWSARQVATIRRTKDYTAAVNRKKPDPVEAAKRRKERIARKHPTLKSVLPAACEAMFNLNRFAKWKSCSRDNKDEIYEVKNEFVRALYRSGYADRCYIHIAKTDAKECFGCDGTGVHWSGDDCERCDGSGIYQEAGELTFVCFSFVVDGQRYTWHQPRDYVSYRYMITESNPPGSWAPGEVKPIFMERAKFTDAKGVVRRCSELLRQSEYQAVTKA